MILFKPFNLTDYADCLVVTDERLASLYKISGDNVYLLPEGESAKRFAEAEKLCQWFLSRNLNRDGKVAAIGGGSVGDTVGFACSVYKRGGVKLVNVPTTLIAQIDSGIGGKTALNVGNVKNAVGSFYDADTVIDVNFLKTLDGIQIKSGLGELLKYRMLSREIDSAYNGEITERVIKLCAEYKQSVCSADPYDRNVRKKLNFGHTVGHAMELVLNVAHGYAVANGIYYETKLAYLLGKCDRAYCGKWTGEVAKLFDIYPLDESMLRLTAADKKNAGASVCFMLPDGLGETYLTVDKAVELLC